MRIVSYEEFIELPEGTVYAECEPCVIRGIKVKREQLSKNDWYFSSLLDNLDDIEDWDEAEKGEEIKLDFESWTRDGMFDYDRRFAIYSKKRYTGIHKSISFMSEIKYSDIEKVVHEVIAKASEDKRYAFIMYQGCKTKGTVKRTAIDLCLCDNPECLSCGDIKKALKEINHGK